MKRLLAFALVVLAAALLPGRGWAQDDEYVRIYTLIEQADAQNASGEPGPALTKYRQAQTTLQAFQRQYPEWNVQVVNFRLNYLATRIAEASARVPGATNAPVEPTAQPATQPPPPATVTLAAVADLRSQLAFLNDQARQLQAQNALLQAKLKEALSAQPAAVDPRDLAKAQTQVQTLLKQNELLKVSLAQTRLQSSVTNAEAAEALRAENALLRKQVADLKSTAPAAGDLKSQLDQAQARIAALTSEAQILRLEKIALESRVKQSAPPAVAAAPSPPTGPNEAARVKQLERERDSLQKQLAAATKELNRLKGKAAGVRVTELTNQVATLRARLEVLEARPVPYTAEELVLFKQPEPAPARTEVTRRGAKELPAGAVTLVAEAQRYFSAKQFDKAEETYRQVLKQDESNVYTLANLAAIELEQNHFDQAEQHLSQALAAAPDDAYSLSILGYLKFRQEKYDDAFTALSRAAQLDPRNPEIQNYLGVTLSHKGLRGPAETALRKALQLDPNYGAAHNNLAVIYLTQEPPLTALARWHYQKALAAGHPHNPELEKMLEQKESTGKME